MHHVDVWSLSLGRWRGVQVKLHMFFLLFATFTCYLAWQLSGDDADGSGLAWMAALCIGLLFASVLVHDLGHCIVARRLGGAVDAIVIGPVGGLYPIRIPSDPQSEMLVALAGPLISLLVCATTLIIVMFSGELDAYKLLHPLSPAALVDPSINGQPFAWRSILCLTSWINWILFLINLIPAFPFDGGRACLAFLQTIRPNLGHRQAVVLVAALAKVVAIGLLIAAWFFRDNLPISVVPTWLALVLLAIFVFFSARVEEDQPDVEELDSELFGYDFSQGFTSLERTSNEPPATMPGPMSRWWQRIQRKREQRRRQNEANEDRRLDEILDRLHKQGEKSLTAAEKALLRRVSARYRGREDQ